MGTGCQKLLWPAAALGRESWSPRLFWSGVLEPSGAAPKASGGRPRVLWLSSEDPCCTIQTFPHCVCWALAYNHPAPQTSIGGPLLLFQIPLSVSFAAAARTRFLPFERKKRGEFHLSRSDSPEVFRSHPPSLAPPPLRCCQLPVSCQPLSPGFYSHPQNLGCGLPGSMRKPPRELRGRFPRC